jgi:hypothetical protein
MVGVGKLCRNDCSNIVEKHTEKLSIYMINIINKIINMDRIYFSIHKEVFKAKQLVSL